MNNIVQEFANFQKELIIYYKSESVRILKGVFDFLTDTNQKIWFFGVHSLRLEKTINVLYNAD